MKRISIAIMSLLLISWSADEFKVPEKFKPRDIITYGFDRDSAEAKEFRELYQDFRKRALASGEWYEYKTPSKANDDQMLEDARQMFGYDYPGMVKPTKIEWDDENDIAQYTFKKMKDMTPAYKFILTRTTRALPIYPPTFNDWHQIYLIVPKERITKWKEEMERVVHAKKIEKLERIPDQLCGIWKTVWGEGEGKRVYAKKWTLRVGNTGGLLIEPTRLKANYRSEHWTYINELLIFKVYPKEGKPYIVLWIGPAGSYWDKFIINSPNTIIDEMYRIKPPVPSVTEDVGYRSIRRMMIRY